MWITLFHNLHWSIYQIIICTYYFHIEAETKRLEARIEAESRAEVDKIEMEK